MANLLERGVSRRQFTAASISALFVGMAVTLIDCGGSGAASTTVTAPTPVPTSGGTTPSSGGDVTGVISDNHGHSAVVTSAQHLAGGDVVLSIQGTADHTHTVTLTAAQVTQIAAKTTVTVPSSITTAYTDSGYGATPFTHSHVVVFN